MAHVKPFENIFTQTVLRVHRGPPRKVFGKM
jgi:hypothetical protein